MGVGSLVSKGAGAAAGPLKILDGINAAKDLVEQTKGVVDSVSGIVEDVGNWFDPTSPDDLGPLGNLAKEARDAANEAKQAAEEGAFHYEVGGSAGFLWDDIHAIMYVLGQVSGAYEPVLPNRSIPQVLDAVVTVDNVTRNTRQYLFSLIELVQGAIDGLARYQPNTAGIAAFEADVTGGKIAGSGLIVLYTNEDGQRVPVLNPKLLTVQSPRGQTYDILDVILGALNGLPIFPRD